MMTMALAHRLERNVEPSREPDPRPERKPPSSNPNGGGNGPSPVVLLAVTAVIVVGGYFLSGKLREMARIQDCAMSGRTNCAPIDTSSADR
jgi:hypothetical protein